MFGQSYADQDIQTLISASRWGFYFLGLGWVGRHASLPTECGQSNNTEKNLTLIQLLYETIYSWYPNLRVVNDTVPIHLPGDA